MTALALRISTAPTVSRLEIPAYGATLMAELTVPNEAAGIVILPSVTRATALEALNSTTAALHQHGYATLVIELLTAGEQRLDGRLLLLGFDLPFLAKRLAAVATWLVENHVSDGMTIGLVCAGHASGAALHAAAMRPSWLAAVVAGGDLSDVAPGLLARIIAPTLLLARQSDPLDTARGRLAQRGLSCPNELVLVEDQRAGDGAVDANEDNHRTIEWVDRYVRRLVEAPKPAGRALADITPAVSSRRRSPRRSWRYSARTASAS